MKHRNTLQKGVLRCLVLREGDVWYVVGLEFNIVVEAAHPMEALLLLHEAAAGYLESTRKVKMRPHVLNQKPDPEYEKMWQEYWDGKLKEKYESVVRALPIFSGGWMDLAWV